MAEQVVALLNANTTITSLIGANHIYPISTDYTGNCIVYDFYTMTNDKVKKHSIMEITIIADSVADTVTLETAINDTILTMDDTKLNNTILAVEQNGGGTLYDYARRKQHRILRYDIIWR